MKKSTAIFFLIIALVLPACAAEEPQQGMIVTPPAMSVTITGENCPAMEVQAGMQVVWLNGDTVALPINLEQYDDDGNVTDIGQSEINPGDYFSTQFQDAGTYRIYCSDNRDVYGTITVE